MTVLTFVQTSGTVVEIDFGWPIEVKWFSSVLATIGSFDLTGAAAPECAYKLDAVERWLLTTLLPIFPLLLLGWLVLWVKIAEVPFCCCARVFRCCGKITGAFQRLVGWLENKALAIFLVTYVVIVRSAFSPFDCVGDGGGKTYMRDNPAMECNYDHGGTTNAATDKSGTTGATEKQHGMVVIFSGIALGFSGLAVVIIAIALRCGRAGLHSDESKMRAFGALYLRYDTDCYYWEVLVLLRKLLLVFITRVWSTNQPMQIAGCAVVLGGALALQHCFKPFLSDALDALEERTLVACMGIVLLGIASYLEVAPPQVITALYCVVMMTSAWSIAHALRAVWREGCGSGGGSATGGGSACGSVGPGSAALPPSTSRPRMQNMLPACESASSESASSMAAEAAQTMPQYRGDSKVKMVPKGGTGTKIVV